MKNAKVITLGAALMAVSLFNAETTNTLVQASAIILLSVFVLMPLVAFVVNPITEKILSSNKLNFIGSKGKSFLRMMFTVNIVRAKN